MEQSNDEPSSSISEDISFSSSISDEGEPVSLPNIKHLSLKKGTRLSFQSGGTPMVRGEDVSSPQQPRFRLPTDMDAEKIELAVEGGLDSLFNLYAYDDDQIHSLAEICISAVQLTDDGRATLKGDAGYKALKELVNIDIPYVRGEAIWTLAILASVPKSNRKIVKLFGWQDLLELTESDDLEIKRAMATLLGNLALFDEHHRAMIGHSVIDALVKLGKINDIKTKRATVNAIANIAIEEDNITALEKCGALHLIFELIRINDKELLRGCVHTLANLTNAESSPELKQTIVEEVTWQRLAEVMQTADLMTLKGVMMAVANLTAIIDFHEELIEIGIVNQIIMCTRVNDVEITLSIAMALNNLAANRANHDLLIKQGCAVLQKLYQTSDEDIKQEALEALFELSPEQIGNQKYEQDLSVSVLSSDSDSEAPSISPRGPPDDEASSQFSFEQRSMMAESVAELEVPLEEAIPALLGNLPHINVDVAYQRAREVDRLFGLDEVLVEKIIRECGGIKILSAICLSTHNELAITGTVLLRKLSKFATSRADIFSKDGLKPLVDNILSDDNELRIESLRTILAIIKTVQNQNSVRESAAISRLLSIASEPKNADPVVLSLTLEILCRVAHDNMESQKAIMKDHGMDTFIDLLLADNDDLRSKAARALAGLCSNNRRFQTLAREKGVFEKLVPFLYSENSQVKKNAAACIADLAKNDYKNQLHVKKTGGIVPIIRMLEQRVDSLIASAASAIASLSSNNKKIQKLVRENGGIGALVKLLQSTSPQVLLHTCEALIQLVKDNAKNQDLICELNAPQFLMKLIESPATNIQIEATTIACILSKKKGKRRDYFLQQRIVEILTKASERATDPNFKATITSAKNLFNSEEKKRNKRTKQKS
eukprot:TRINITY_DN4145_c0_g1_i1.p1 TRINITY_DN4145_c0_g1~~TRINITY_DN4145_c0_g1_i1.p1  ORF type:complete len:890 (-),score=159.19 TRINITY_DN4145_c0_g1_i1:87-2756(-)